MTLADKFVGLIFIAILMIIAIYFIADSYFIYRRLNNTVDKLINHEPNMPNKDKSTNLWWICNNCAMFSRRSIFFKRKFDNLIVKIQDAIIQLK